MSYYKVLCPKCNNNYIFYTTVKGVEYSNKHGVICKKCRNELKKEKNNIIYKRKCPKCGKELVTKNKYWNNKSIINNTPCLSCNARERTFTKSTRKNMRLHHANVSGKNNPFYGKHHSKKTIKKLKDINTGVDRMSVEYKNKLRKRMVGKNNPFYGKHHSKKTIEKLSNISEELRRLRRKNTLSRLKECGGVMFNRNACVYFDKLSKEKGWNIQHALNGGEIIIDGYSVDGYDMDKNIVIEYDESRHYNIRTGKLKYKDVIRQNRIIKYCRCRFFRYNAKINKLYEIKQKNT